MGEITLNMTLTLADSSVTQPLSILWDVLVHVNGLVFPANFVVLDTKGYSWGPVILGWPFLEIGKAKINVETGELVLKFKKKLVFKVYDWIAYVEELDICYQLEEKGSKGDKGKWRSELTGVRVSLAPNVPYAWNTKLMTKNKRWVGGNPSVITSFFLQNLLYYYSGPSYRGISYSSMPLPWLFIVFNKQVCNCVFFFKFASVVL